MIIIFLIALLVAVCIGSARLLKDQPLMVRLGVIGVIAAVYQFVPLMAYRTLESVYYYKQSDQALAFGVGYFYIIALPAMFVAVLIGVMYAVRTLYRYLA